jgi:hypothetical protein
VSTNWGDALLETLRTQLVTVPTLPAERRWQNTSGVPSPTAAFVEDGFVTVDSEPREVGPDAMWRTSVTYRVSIRVPIGTGAHVASAIGADVVAAYQVSTLTVNGEPCEMESARMGPSITEPQWLHMPVYLSLTFDHA